MPTGMTVWVSIYFSILASVETINAGNGTFLVDSGRMPKPIGMGVRRTFRTIGIIACSFRRLSRLDLNFPDESSDMSDRKLSPVFAS
jgi:hypothetical protein